MKRKGLSLTELIIALTLGVMVMGIGVQLIWGSSSSSFFARKEKHLQDMNRIFLSYTDNAIKYSTATFTIADSTFNAPNNEKLTPEWNYIGVKRNITVPGKMTRSGADLDAKTALVAINYKGKIKPDETKLREDETLITITDSGAEHYFVQKIIAFSDLSGDKEFLYDLKFLKPTVEGSAGAQESNSLNYEMKLTLVDGTSQKIDYGTIKSKLTSLNSLQVIDRGSPSDPAVAIAYRTDNVYLQKEGAHGVISMVLDNSGSMRANDLKDASGRRQRRIDILKIETGKLLKILSANKAADVEIVPFDNYVLVRPDGKGGYIRPAFYSASQEYREKIIGSDIYEGELKKAVDRLGAYSGTNTGAGLRYAFYSIDEKNKSLLNEHPDKAFRDYLIILVDGESNRADIIPTLEGNYISKSKDKTKSIKKSNTNPSYRLSHKNGVYYFPVSNSYFKTLSITYNYAMDNSFEFKEPETERIHQEEPKREINLLEPKKTIYNQAVEELSSDYKHIVVHSDGREKSIQDAYVSLKSNPWMIGSSEAGNKYVSVVGGLYKNPNKYLTTSSMESQQAIQDMITDKRVYLIAFSNDVSTDGLNAIANAFSIQGDSKRVFKATSGEDLSKIFQDIGESINNDLWMVNGPKW